MRASGLGVWVLALGIACGTPAPAALGETVKGKCQLVDPRLSKQKLPEVALGKDLKFRMKLLASVYAGAKTVRALGEAENVGGGPRHYLLCLAFFDKDGNLVASLRDRAEVRAGDKRILDIHESVPVEAIAKVASYQVTAYESTEEVGKFEKE